VRGRKKEEIGKKEEICKKEVKRKSRFTPPVKMGHSRARPLSL
jgi:hypothetical protein